MTDNLISKIEELSEFEKAFTVRKVNEIFPDMNVHLGTLPFVNLKVIGIALRSAVIPNEPTSAGRRAKAILEKLQISDLVKFRLELNDLKVFSRSRGEGTSKRVITLRITKMVGAGIRWEHFKKKWVKPETMVRQQTLISRVRPGLWEVEVPKKYVRAAREELFTLCGEGFDEYRKLRIKKNQFSGGEFVQKPRTGKELQRPRTKASNKGFDGSIAKPLIMGARNIKIMGKKPKRKKQ